MMHTVAQYEVPQMSSCFTDLFGRWILCLHSQSTSVSTLSPPPSPPSVHLCLHPQSTSVSTLSPPLSPPSVHLCLHPQSTSVSTLSPPLSPPSVHLCLHPQSTSVSTLNPLSPLSIHLCVLPPSHITSSPTPYPPPPPLLPSGEHYQPKMAVVVVQKRISTRIFCRIGRGLDNPPPGTVVDHTITRRGM